MGARWRDAVVVYRLGERWTEMARRQQRARRRVTQRVWVPPARAAHLRDIHQPNLYGAPPLGPHGDAGRRRAAIPMRVVMALWGMGFGAPQIAAIAQTRGVTASSSGIGRVLRQARRAFHGAVEVTVPALIEEFESQR